MYHPTSRSHERLSHVYQPLVPAVIQGPKLGQASPFLRIYLDQKDFSSIAVGLSRGDPSNPAVVAYDKLRRLVAAGRLRVYYSVIHIIETIRFADVTSPRSVAHCQIVDDLTQGHCLRIRTNLERAELELALSDLFGFPTTYSREEYVISQKVSPRGFSKPFHHPGGAGSRSLLTAL